MGVYREEVYSPGKIIQDSAIMDSAIAASTGAGFLGLAVLKAENMSRDIIDGMGALTTNKPACVLTMAQSNDALVLLDRFEKNRIRVINSVRSVRNCYRKILFRCLRTAGIPLPRFQTFPTGALIEDIPFEMPKPYWIKRADVHAMAPGDVVCIRSEKELENAIDHFLRKNIQEVLVQEHVDGEVVKFYGIGPDTFFEAFRVSTGERVTGQMGQLSRIATLSANAVGLEIFGGDAVVDPAGRIFLIDLNDWPSFSPCLQQAAESIAIYITHTILGGRNDSVACEKRQC